MAREKKCKDCGIDFVGFTPVCKECNSKKGQEIAEENKNKTRNMPGALSAVPRRSQKTAENAEAPTTNAPEPEKKNLFNQNNNNNNSSSNNNNYNNYNNNNFNFKNMNNNNVPYNNNVPDFRNNNQTSNQFYSQNNVFGNGFNRKKKTEGGGNANPGEHQNNQNEHMASLFSRNRNYQNGNQNRNGEEKQTYQTLKAFDFKNNKNQAGGRGLGDRNVFKEEVKEEEVLNPFTHLKKVCESFKDGVCKYGQKCTYFHPTEEDVISKDVKPKKVDRSNISKDRFGTKL